MLRRRVHRRPPTIHAFTAPSQPSHVHGWGPPRHRPGPSWSVSSARLTSAGGAPYISASGLMAQGDGAMSSLSSVVALHALSADRPRRVRSHRGRRRGGAPGADRHDRAPQPGPTTIATRGPDGPTARCSRPRPRRRPRSRPRRRDAGPGDRDPLPDRHRHDRRLAAADPESSRFAQALLPGGIYETLNDARAPTRSSRRTTRPSTRSRRAPSPASSSTATPSHRSRTTTSAYGRWLSADLARQSSIATRRARRSP